MAADEFEPTRLVYQFPGKSGKRLGSPSVGVAKDARPGIQHHGDFHITEVDDLDLVGSGFPHRHQCSITLR
ncbi:MAG: hypothetical protein IIC70_12360 [Acidobacteria bacterium]|nr:hypothetical protein [Acidobacteriota bacterium]